MAEETPDEAHWPDRREGAPHPREALALFGQEAAEREALLAWDRLPAGWLLAGPEGVGKATLAYRLAGSLLAGGPRPVALGLPPEHPDARLVRAGAHPRLLVVRRSPDDKGRLRTQITVEDARRLGPFLGLSAADGGRRVVLVDASDDLNPSAANALLKLLEEPPARAHLLLVAHRPARLLPTIRSRCRVLRLQPLAPPDLGRALAAIGLEGGGEALAELAGGSVGRAVDLLAGGGLEVAAEIVALLTTLPRLDRAGALRLAESCAGRGAEARLSLVLDLLDALLARLARAGLGLRPAAEAAPGEAALHARLAPSPAAARLWAEAQGRAVPAARAGRGVNLDPAALLLDTLLQIEDAARRAA